LSPRRKRVLSFFLFLTLTACFLQSQLRKSFGAFSSSFAVSDPESAPRVNKNSTNFDHRWDSERIQDVDGPDKTYVQRIAPDSIEFTVTSTAALPSKQPTSTNQEGIAACLLVLEDSVRLFEWIAYHYTMLPLNRLVIALDPKNPTGSVERIEEIASRYAELNDISIDLWYNDSFIEDEEIKDAIHAYEAYAAKHPEIIGKSRKAQHEQYRVPGLIKKMDRLPQRRRQLEFSQSCMRHHKKNGASWVLLTDTDEFLVYNYLHTEEEKYEETKYSSLGNEKRDPKLRQAVDRKREQNLPIRQRLPSISNTTVMNFFKELQPKRRCFRIPCTAYRGNYSIIDSSTTSTDALPQNVHRLSTFVERQHEGRHGVINKVMLDVSRIQDPTKKGAYVTIHTPNGFECSAHPANRYSCGTDYIAAPFRLNHYQGSLEAYLERTLDYRGRTKKMYDARDARLDWSESDSDIIPWIQQFVGKVGIETADRLLQFPDGLGH
jgi:hypothetical protein